MLTVEDGTGLTNSDSYISIVDATTYFTNFGGLDAWSNLDPTTLEALLRKSTRDLDALYGPSYASEILNTSQSLLWPRATFFDANGRTINGLPVQVGYAVAELALINSTIDVTGPSDTTGNVKFNKTTVDTLSVWQEFFAPTATSANTIRKVALLLSPYLQGGSGGLFARVVRG